LSGVRTPAAALDVINITGTATAGGNLGDILITGCNVHDFNRLVYGNVINKLKSFKVDNSVLTNFLTSTADFIDFRITYVTNIALTNSTFNNCATARDFIRVDGSGTGNLNNTGLNTDVLIDHCTISNKNMTAANRLLYVRFATNTSTVRKSLFADSPAIYTNQPTTTAPTFLNNNYYTSINLFTIDATITNQKVDASGTFTTLNPQFMDSTNGNFKVQNQTLIDGNVGDPRWLK